MLNHITDNIKSITIDFSKINLVTPNKKRKNINILVNNVRMNDNDFKLLTQLFPILIYDILNKNLYDVKLKYLSDKINVYNLNKKNIFSKFDGIRNLDKIDKKIEQECFANGFNKLIENNSDDCTFFIFDNLPLFSITSDAAKIYYVMNTNNVTKINRNTIFLNPYCLLSAIEIFKTVLADTPEDNVEILIYDYNYVITDTEFITNDKKEFCKIIVPVYKDSIFTSIVKFNNSENYKVILNILDKGEIKQSFLQIEEEVSSSVDIMKIIHLCILIIEQNAKELLIDEEILKLLSIAPIENCYVKTFINTYYNGFSNLSMTCNIRNVITDYVDKLPDNFATNFNNVIMYISQKLNNFYINTNVAKTKNFTFFVDRNIKKKAKIIMNNIKKMNNDIKQITNFTKNITVPEISLTNLFTSSISLTNWTEELEMASSLGILLNIQCNDNLKKFLYDALPNIIDITFTFFSTHDYLELVLSKSKNTTIFDINITEILNGDAVGNSNVLIPLYISNMHWKVARIHLKYFLGIALENNPFGFTVNHLNFLFYILEQMVELSFTKQQSDKWFEIFFAIYRTCIEIATERKFYKGIKKMIKKILLNDKKYSSKGKIFSNKIIFGQILSTGCLISTGKLKKLCEIIRNQQEKDKFTEAYIESNCEMILIMKDIIKIEGSFINFIKNLDNSHGVISIEIIKKIKNDILKYKKID